jgi:hypothetical protein
MVDESGEGQTIVGLPGSQTRRTAHPIILTVRRRPPSGERASRCRRNIPESLSGAIDACGGAGWSARLAWSAVDGPARTGARDPAGGLFLIDEMRLIRYWDSRQRRAPIGRARSRSASGAAGVRALVAARTARLSGRLELRTESSPRSESDTEVDTFGLGVTRYLLASHDARQDQQVACAAALADIGGIESVSLLCREELERVRDELSWYWKIPACPASG